MCSGELRLQLSLKFGWSRAWFLFYCVHYLSKQYYHNFIRFHRLAVCFPAFCKFLVLGQCNDDEEEINRLVADSKSYIYVLKSNPAKYVV